MSAKGLGMTLVEGPGGEVAGIVTDGDVRRAMQQGFDREAPVTRCMSVDPARVSPAALASEALHELEERKITSLVVTDDGRAVGVVHLHDLWRTQMV